MQANLKNTESSFRKISHNVGFNKDENRKSLTKQTSFAKDIKNKTTVNFFRQYFKVFLDDEDVTPLPLYVPPPSPIAPSQEQSVVQHGSSNVSTHSKEKSKSNILLNLQSINLFQSKLYQQTWQFEQSFLTSDSRHYATFGDSTEIYEVPTYVSGEKYQDYRKPHTFLSEISEGESKTPVFVTETTLTPEQQETESGITEKKGDSQEQQQKEQQQSEMPKTITLTLEETETYFIFEIRSTCVEKDSEEGVKAEEDNILYEYMTVGKGRNRKVVQAETQTPVLLVKNVSTMAERPEQQDQSSYVSNFVMFDSYEENEEPEKDRSEADDQSQENTTSKKVTVAAEDPEKELEQLLQNENFLKAVTILERLLDSVAYHEQLKRYRNIIKEDITRLDMQYNFRLDLLWTFKNWHTKDRPVADVCWNPVNHDILAVGYGKYYYLGKNDGMVMIWNIKNPTQPERTYSFNYPVTSISFCVTQPNLLGVGTYNGRIYVLNIASYKLCIVTRSSNETSPCYEAIWKMRWFSSEDSHGKIFDEHLMATTQDGRVNKYKLVSKGSMPCFQVMRIIREEGKLKGAPQYRSCPAEPITIARYSPATVFTPHPVNPAVYFVGTYEGTVHKCSKSNYHQHIEVFLAHNGPIFSMRFSPFGNKIFLTCGADWKLRIWAEGIVDPLIEFGCGMLAVENACWHPVNSTIIASITGNEIHMWDIGRKIYQPQSITVSPNQTSRYVTCKFSKCGKNIIVGDIDGNIDVFTLEEMPIPPHDGPMYLQIALEKALITKPNLLTKLQKLGSLNHDK